MTANAERLNKVADMIEAYPEHFDMARFLIVGNEEYGSDEAKYGTIAALRDAPLTACTDCGTTACIAGWAVHLWHAEVLPGDNVEEAATRILGLDHQATVGFGGLFSAAHRTPSEAADSLRRMALGAEQDQ